MTSEIAQKMYSNAVAATPAPASTASPTLAQRMYGGSTTPPAPAPTTALVSEAPTATPPPGDEAGQATVAEAASLELDETIAERLFEASGPAGDSPKQYSDVSLEQTFDQLERQARYDRNEADVQALTTGRHDAANLMHELGVSLQGGRELSNSLGRWVSRQLDGPALAAAGEQCEASLRKDWGASYDRKVALAQKAYQHAAGRLPWMADLALKGAGNDPQVVKHFADVGLRMERAAKRSKP